MKLIKLVSILCLVTLWTGCVVGPLPLEDYALARAAINSAKSIEASKYSAGYFHKAEIAYRQGETFVEDKDYEKAKEEFMIARQYAEKAENSARLIRFKNGEVL